MPRNTAAGIYISIFAFLAGFAFVWHVNWLAVVSIIAIIVCVVVRTFNDNVEYTIPAAEVKRLEEARQKKDAAVRQDKSPDSDEDMGLWQFVKIVAVWALDVIKNKRWQTWKHQ